MWKLNNWVISRASSHLIPFRDSRAGISIYRWRMVLETLSNLSLPVSGLPLCPNSAQNHTFITYWWQCLLNQPHDGAFTTWDNCFLLILHRRSLWPGSYQWPRGIIPYSRCPRKLYLLLSECSWKHRTNPWCVQFLCEWRKQSLWNSQHQCHHWGKDYRCWGLSLWPYNISLLKELCLNDVISQS